jgi:hypothetical protein
MTMSPHLVDAAPPAGTDHGDPNPVADSGETVDERRPLVDLFRDLRKRRLNGLSKPSPRSFPRPPASYATEPERRSPPATSSPVTC